MIVYELELRVYKMKDDIARRTHVFLQLRTLSINCTSSQRKTAKFVEVPFAIYLSLST